VSNILSCPTCAAVILPQEAGEFCPKCRTPLPQSAIATVMPQDLPGMDDATRLAPGSGSASGSGSAPSKSGSSRHDRGSRDSRPSSSTGWLSSSGAIDHGRFEPGTLLGGRYRIVERLGRGGMGEVYRADDLKLGQPVALKFLPPDVDRDPARLTQLHTEVRMARQVSHPNVCRVYDIDEVDGATFLSMEYVDGEDLSSLLKRVGRFPEDRALEIARQICAGLAAAHERDVIHRDLKPANVMLDGTGKVRITDFGLAGASGEAIRAGTPAYMAPEQLSGNEVTAVSDIYALGLVLYEIFTGQRALDGKNLAELIHKREQSGILPPTAIVKTLDPKIERVILKCLRPEAGDRPSSALAVSAALPGGDPLAAALAAGETPSPAMVAAAASREALSIRATVAATAWIVLSVVFIVVMYQRVILLNRVPLPKPPAALQDRAEEALASLGYDLAGAVDTASGLGLSRDYARFIESSSTAPDRWNLLRTVRPETIFFWHRTSPRLLVPWGTENQVGRANPPLTMAGMTLVAVDANGRLSEFHAVPSPTPPDTPVAATDWQRLFAAAGLAHEKFVPAKPEIVPPFYADERRAWEGPLPDRPGLTIRIEGAATAGKPVYFAIAGPWSRSARALGAAPGAFIQVIGLLAAVLMPALMVLGAAFARINLKAGRGDRAGAFRVATFIFVTSLVAWALGASHIPSFNVEIGRVFAAVGRGLFEAGLVWVTYLGLEPYIRRYSPDSILGWTTLVAGHWRDPRVGVDAMVGVSAGLAMTLLYALHNLLPPMAGFPEPMPLVWEPDTLNGLRHVLSAIATELTDSVNSGMLAVAGVVGFVLLIRNRALAMLAAIVCFTPAVISGMFPGTTPRLDLAIGAGIITIFILTIVRAGLLSAVAALFTHFVLLRAPITTDFSSWHATAGMWHVGTVLALGLGACYIANRGQEGRHQQPA
jgi:tRNA A-37 threonylcarbamoyl transferase component Bud32